MEPDTRSHLEGNIRRFKWHRWYEKHNCLKWIVKAFWYTSDYGQSTRRVIVAFFLSAALFAALYCVKGLVAGLHEKAGVQTPNWMVPVRALYFSVVTMTTLGFGDMHAALDARSAYTLGMSIAGHVLLTIQVLLGYVMLAALVTRLSVLFRES